MKVDSLRLKNHINIGHGLQLQIADYHISSINHLQTFVFTIDAKIRT